MSGVRTHMSKGQKSDNLCPSMHQQVQITADNIARILFVMNPMIYDSHKNRIYHIILKGSYHKEYNFPYSSE